MYSIIYVHACMCTAVKMYCLSFWGGGVNVTTRYTLVKTRHRRVSTYYSVKRTQLIVRRPLLPCRVRKTAGYTLPRLLFSRTVPPFSEIYPDLAGSGTLPSAIFSARITFRSQRRTPKPKSPCSKQAMATGIASLTGPFSYRNRTPHLYEIFLLRFVIWLLRAYKYRPLRP